MTCERCGRADSGEWVCYSHGNGAVLCYRCAEPHMVDVAAHEREVEPPPPRPPVERPAPAPIPFQDPSEVEAFFASGPQYTDQQLEAALARVAVKEECV